MRLIIVCFLVIAFSGCSILPPQPRDVGDTIATGYVTVESLAESIGQAQLAGQISTDEEDRLLDQLQIAQDSLTTAKVASAKDQPQNAEEALALAQRILTELQIRLEAR